MIIRIILTVCFMIITAVPQASAEELRPVSFLPQWIPQAQFAGYYMAYEKGFYRKNGIDLNIMRGGPEHSPTEAITSNKVNFTTMFLSSAIKLRNQGVRLVNIGQIVQRSGFVLVSKKSSGIEKPSDLQRKKVSLWADFRLQPQAFFRKYRVDVQPIYQGATMDLFLRGGVAAASAMWYNEYHGLLNSGINEDELNTFFFDQHGLNFPEDGIYALEETVRRDADLCRRFVRASLDGWEYAFANPEESLDVVMKYILKANIGTNRVHQKWMLARMGDIIMPPGNHSVLGRLKPEDYLRVGGEMKESGLIKAVPSFGEMYADFTSRR